MAFSLEEAPVDLLQHQLDPHSELHLSNLHNKLPNRVLECLVAKVSWALWCKELLLVQDLRLAIKLFDPCLVVAQEATEDLLSKLNLKNSLSNSNMLTIASRISNQHKFNSKRTRAWASTKDYSLVFNRTEAM